MQSRSTHGRELLLGTEVSLLGGRKEVLTATAEMSNFPSRSHCIAMVVEKNSASTSPA